MSLTITPLDIDPIEPLELFLGIPDAVEGVSLLASDGSEGSRYTILTANPVHKIQYDGQQVLVDGVGVSDELNTVLNRFVGERQISADSPLPFLGGLIGSVDYEYGQQVLDLNASDRTPSMVHWQLYDHALIFDHQQSRWVEVLRGDNKCMDWQSWITSRQAIEEQGLSLTPQWNMERYTAAFTTLKDHIKRGEIYQACLTFPFTGDQTHQPRQLFAHLLQQNPAPMAAYLEQGDRQILSLSPERLLYWDGSLLESKPIKGTRTRGTTPEEDVQQRNDLLKNEKEMAELNMITDLLRNDLAKVSVPGSVEVVEHQALLECPSVWHAYSQIQSRSKPELEAWDILSSMLPGGSISGCPKRRAVELLCELEGEARGIYTGCIGFISDHRQMDMNIAIRTLENTPQGMRAGFGGGIVYDSDLNEEYRECFAKARSLVPDLPLPSAKP